MRSLKDDDSAVSVVIGTVLILAILVTFMAGFLNYWVPVYEKQNEMDHSREVLGSFTDIQMKIDNIDHFPVRIPIDVGTNSIFYLSGTRTYGELEVNESDYWITITSENFNGNGNSNGNVDNDFTQISNWENLAEMSLDGNYILMNDLDENTDDYEDFGEDWTPIDNFDGTFDGNGYTITGLTITATGNGNELGLFGSANGNAVIKNVELLNININLTGQAGSQASNNNNIGGLIGTNSGTIENSSSNGSINIHASGGGSNNNNVGGLVGLNTEDGIVINSESTVNLDNINLGGGNNEIGNPIGNNKGEIIDNGNNNGNNDDPIQEEVEIFSAGSISLTSDYNSLVNQKYIYAQGSIILEQDEGGVLWEEPLLRYNHSSQTIYIRLVEIEGNRVSYGNFKDSLRITLIDRKTSALSPASDGEIKIQYKENDLWNKAFEDFFNNIPGNTYSPGEIIIHSENLNLIVEK